MAKYAFLGGVAGLDGRSASAFLDLPLDQQVARCAAIKAEVVTADEREGDRRMVLNYGHTLAHALEASAFDAEPGSDLRHGEAVAIGLVFAGLLASRLGRIDEERAELHRQVVRAFDLSPLLPGEVDPEQLLSFMSRDKKADHDLTFVLEGPDGVEVVRGIDGADVVATLAEMQHREGGRGQ
jgi:5-deoxy-5-amino-3-dehydroquinate synthase